MDFWKRKQDGLKSANQNQQPWPFEFDKLLIYGSENRICRLSFELWCPHVELKNEVIKLLEKQ